VEVDGGAGCAGAVAAEVGGGDGEVDTILFGAEAVEVRGGDAEKSAGLAGAAAVGTSALGESLTRQEYAKTNPEGDGENERENSRERCVNRFDEVLPLVYLLVH
jgi:hypothetical protein